MHAHIRGTGFPTIAVGTILILVASSLHRRRPWLRGSSPHDIASVEFGNDKLNEEAVNSTAPPIFEAQKYPTAYYKGKLGGFVNGSPTTVTGLLTLHGITKPVALRIDSFKCVVDLPATQKHVCGADVVGTFNRADFGITVGQRYGFKMEVTLHIQVEAFRVE